MKPIVFGARVKGAAHERSGLPCQDYFAICDNNFYYPGIGEKKEFYSGLSDDTVIISVADGHGSSACPYSEIGSRVAVNVFCDMMAQYCYKYQSDMSSLERLLNKESNTIRIAQSIEYDWKNRVQRDYSLNKRKRPESLTTEEEKNDANIHRLYGTTLLGALITGNFIFSFQLGDGDIVLVEEDQVRPLLKNQRLLGVETHSLSKKDAWNNAVTNLHRIAEFKSRPMMLLFSTDGLSNSYVSDNEFNKSAVDYLRLIHNHGVGRVREQLEKWLSETSLKGCGDDITAIFAYYD